MKRICKAVKRGLPLLVSLTFLGGCTAQTAVQGGDGKEITISVSDSENGYIALAAQRYQEKTGVKVNVEFIEESDKYVQITTAELLNQGGPDIVDASALNLYKTAEQGLLGDLNEYIGDKLSSSEYYLSMLDAYLYNSKRYTVPLNFNFYAYKPVDEAFTENGLDSKKGITAQGFEEIIEALPDDGSVKLSDGGGWGGMSGRDLFETLYGLEQERFFDMASKTVNFDGGEFESILGLVAKAQSKNILYSMEDTEDPSNYLFEEYAIYGPTNCHNGTVDYTGFDIMTNSSGKGMFSSNSFRPALNAGGKNKETAADFILFLLSEEMQSSPELIFSPVNRAALKITAKRQYESGVAEGYITDDFTAENLENNIKIFDEMSSRLGVINYPIPQIRSFIREEINPYIDGEQDAEQTLLNLQHKISTYVNE